LKESLISELIFATEGTIERIEIDPYSPCMVVQYAAEQGNELYAWPSGQTHQVPDHAYLDHVQQGLACMLLTGSGSEWGVVGSGAVVLATGVAIWQESGAGRWLPTREHSLWLTADNRLVKPMPSGSWQEGPRLSQADLRQSVLEREAHLAHQLATAYWLEPDDDEYDAAQSMAQDCLGHELKPPLLWAKSGAFCAFAGCWDPSGEQPCLHLIYATASTKYVLNVSSENPADGLFNLMLWNGELWYLQARNRLLRLADTHDE
jgi:hypothetical protein